MLCEAGVWLETRKTSERNNRFPKSNSYNLIAMKEETTPTTNREYRYTFRLTEEENARFLARFEQSGAHTKTKFILGMLFEREFRVVTTDIEKHKYYVKLSDYYRQFRCLANSN